jgi:tripartite-type tricarboxylate transporter receptor subunit TctC
MNQCVTRLALLIGISTAVHGMMSFHANSQEFPTRALRLIVPTAPGGSLDLVARRMGQKASESLGQPVIVENVAGANGAIAAAQVARSAPDGHTLMIAAVSQMMLVQLLRITPPYDPVKEFTPIMLGVKSIDYVFAGPKSPVNSFKELIEYSRRNPEVVTYGSPGIGSEFHLLFELVKRIADVNMLHVPYKGVPAAVTGLASGQVHVIAAGATSVQALGNRAKVLAVIDNKRYAGRPEVPAISEILPTYQPLPGWFSYFGPAKLPRLIQMRLNAVLNGALNNPELRDYFDSAGLMALGGSPEALADSQKTGIEIYAKVIKAAGVKPE